MRKEELTPTEQKNEIPEHFVPFVESDATAIVEVEYGSIGWVPTQMPKGLSIDVAYLQYLQKELKLAGKIHLENLHDNSDQDVSMGSTNGDVATASLSSARKKIKKSETGYDSEHQVHQIKLNIAYMKRKAGDGKNQSEVLAKILSDEIQQAFLNLVIADINRITKEEARLCLNTLAIAMIGGPFLGNLGARFDKLAGNRSTEIGFNEIIVDILLIYLVLRFVIGMFEQFNVKNWKIIEQEIYQNREKFFDKFMAFVTELGKSKEDLQIPQFYLLLILFVVFGAIKEMTVIPGLNQLPRRGKAFKFNHSKRAIVKKSS